MTQDTLPLRMPEPVVILGGGGFIGSNLGHELVRMGYKVKLVDVKFYDWRYSPADLCWMYDLRIPEEAAAAVSGAGTVFHLAADMGGVEYFHSSHDFGAAIDNQLITTNVIKACAYKGIERLVYTSSVCAYDTAQMDDGVLMSEGRLMEGYPDALYGAEKRNGAYMIASAPFDGRVAVLDTVYGPGQEHEGIRMKFPSAVCVHAIESLQTDELVLFGDGRQKRCYLYIDDAVDRLITLAEAPRNEISDAWPVYNIGGTELVCCVDIADMCLDYVGSDAKIRYDRTKPSGVFTRRTSQRRFIDVFGPHPETTPDEGFRKFIDWLLSIGVGKHD